MTLNKIMGDDLIGNSQIRQFYSDENGVFKEYSKGQIAFKNGINNLKYLLDHKTTVSELIEVDVKTINDNKRDLAKVKDYLNRLKNVCELGNVNDPIQMYISKHGNNIGGLDLSVDWVDYILTQKWIDKLATKANGGDYSPSDYRIEYLSDLIEGILTDHIIDYHKKLESFDPSDFLSQPKMTIKNVEIDLPLEDVMNMLNSFGKLDYGFYEIFKPIGGGKGKHIKIKMGTDGYVDISGVVGLSDCDHWEWEYGSEAYLRSLNTGNQRYLLQLDIPLNDESSTLWWKPDNPEELDSEKSPNGESIRNYKEYEVERFLRWFGNDHIPRIDENTLEKCTVCQSPNLTDDTESDNFHTDARNIGESGLDLTRMNIDESTSQSLLYLHPKATIAVRTYVYDEDKKTYRSPILEVSEEDIKEGKTIDDPSKIHQYLEFVVTGNRQTSNVAFDVKGWIGTEIQEKHHYLHTLGQMTKEMESLFNTMLFLEVSEVIVPGITTIWDNLNSHFWEEAIDAKVKINEDWIPRNWIYLEGKLQELLKSPTIIDILRFRQLDFDTIILNNDSQLDIRIEKFMKKLDSNSDAFIDEYCQGDRNDLNDLKALVKNKMVYIENLWKYITNYKDKTYEELSEYYQRITQLADSQKANLITAPLEKMYGKKLPTSEYQATRMKFSSDGDWITYNIYGTLDKTTLENLELVYKLEDGETEPTRDYLLWMRKPYAIEIGTDVTEIGDYAFAKCTSLVSVTIPTSIESIGKEIFRECPNLSSIMFTGRGFSEIKTIKDKNNVLRYPWGLDFNKDEEDENDDYKYIFNKGEFSDVRVKTLRERITTYNNLIVRLPVGPRQHNCIASKRIFQDWKAFVDGAVDYLVERGCLYVKLKEPNSDDPKKRDITNRDNWLIEYWSGTDKDDDGNIERHPYTELYIDKQCTKPLIDYSYCFKKNDQGEVVEVLYDRWDSWEEDDFKWPQ